MGVTFDRMLHRIRRRVSLAPIEGNVRIICELHTLIGKWEVECGSTLSRLSRRAESITVGQTVDEMYPSELVTVPVICICM